MGTWGRSIFDSDTASEYVGDVVVRIVSDLEHDIATINDGVLERTAGPCLALLNAIASASPLDVRTIISTEAVQRWQMSLHDWLCRVTESEVGDHDYWIHYTKQIDEQCTQLSRVVAGTN